MADPSDDDSDTGRVRAGEDTPTGTDEPGKQSPETDGPETADLDALREQVEVEYDFEDFGPADMAEMEREEWEAVFDPETWITGTQLIDRVERDLRNRIATREVFARLERHPGAEGDRLLAYSDEGYAIVNPDGSVEGQGTVLRDVEPTVALCSMEKYDPPEPPANATLPDPDDVTAGTGELGNTMLQLIAAAQILAGIGLLAASVLFDLQPDIPQGGVIGPVIGLGFIAVGAFLFVVVANARLSDRFRAAEYRDRLRAVDEAGKRPEFVPQLSEDGDEEQPP